MYNLTNPDRAAEWAALPMRFESSGTFYTRRARSTDPPECR